MAKRAPIFVVDAFTATPFAGNPAGVCLLDSEMTLTEAQMATIAAEMKHSETAFVSPINPLNGIYRLRWFTPVTEVKLCGHATLATAYALFEEMKVTAETLTFQTLSGDLFVTKDKNSTRLQLNFPTSECEEAKINPLVLEETGKAMNFNPFDVVQTFFEPKSRKLFIEVSSMTTILALKPNFEALVSIKFGIDVFGVSVFTTNFQGSKIEGQGFDVASRYFNPWAGIPEDPVNGSSHTILGPLMAKRLGKNTLLAYMASDRTGVLGLKVLDGNRILLEGDARITLAGSIVLPN